MGTLTLFRSSYAASQIGLWHASEMLGPLGSSQPGICLVDLTRLYYCCTLAHQLWLDFLCPPPTKLLNRLVRRQWRGRLVLGARSHHTDKLRANRAFEKSLVVDSLSAGLDLGLRLCELCGGDVTAFAKWSPSVVDTLVILHSLHTPTDVVAGTAMSALDAIGKDCKTLNWFLQCNGDFNALPVRLHISPLEIGLNFSLH